MEKITMAHGGGGSRMHALIDALFMKELGNPILLQKKDSAIVSIGGRKIAFTTDSYVVDPIIFPGGDIGMLSVCGTVNDLAVCGALPKYISLGLIIEEGLDRHVLEGIIRSINRTAKKAGVDVVTGDTKVVGKGSCDKLYINTSGIGEVYYDGLSQDLIRPGDAVIVSGPIGEHAISVLSRREGISFSTTVKSDAVPLGGLIRKALAVSGKVRFMRDPTRGGVASTLNEIVEKRPFGIALDERAVPVGENVRQACELLGFDPLYLSCEGRVIVIVAKEDRDKVLRAIRKDKDGVRASVIGAVSKEYSGKVYMRTIAGGKRIVGMLSGEQLPRIC